MGASVLLGIALCLGLMPRRCDAAASDADTSTLERTVKAAYLYKFLSYVEWPPSSFPLPDSPYVIAVADDDAVASELVALTKGRTSNNRPITVKRLNFGDSLAGIHLLFIGRQETARQAQWLRQTAKRAVLTVTDSDLGIADGATINFRQIDGRVRFEVSLGAAERNDLKLSSRLLAVAINIRPVN